MSAKSRRLGSSSVVCFVFCDQHLKSPCDYCIAMLCHSGSSLHKKQQKKQQQTSHMLDQQITIGVETKLFVLQEKSIELKDQVVDLSGTAVVSFLHLCRS